MASIKDRFGKGKLGSKQDSKLGGSSLRNKFKRRDQSVLDKTYEDRNSRSKGGSGGKTIFNHELMEKFGIEDFTTTVGDHFIEILPISFNPIEPYFEEVAVHFGVGISNDAYICMQRYKQRKCYRCETQNIMYRDQETYTKDQAKKLYPTDRCAYLLWERTKELIDGEEPDYTFKLWAAPKTKVHSEIQEKARDKINRITLDISDISEVGDGRTVGFTIVKQGDFPDYKAFDLIQRNEPIPDIVLDKLNEIISTSEKEGYNNCIQMFFNIPEYDEIKESMATEVFTDEFGSNTEKQGETSGLRKKLKSKEEETEDPEEKLVKELQVIETELIEISKNPLKWRKWCKENSYEEALEMDKTEAIQAIIDDMYEKANIK